MIILGLAVPFYNHEQIKYMNFHGIIDSFYSANNEFWLFDLMKDPTQQADWELWMLVYGQEVSLPVKL